jgi:hypothetical protein
MPRASSRSAPVTTPARKKPPRVTFDSDTPKASR